MTVNCSRLLGVNVNCWFRLVVFYNMLNSSRPVARGQVRQTGAAVVLLQPREPHVGMLDGLRFETFMASQREKHCSPPEASCARERFEY